MNIQVELRPAGCLVLWEAQIMAFDSALRCCWFAGIAGCDATLRLDHAPCRSVRGPSEMPGLQVHSKRETRGYGHVLFC